ILATVRPGQGPDSIAGQPCSIFPRYGARTRTKLPPWAYHPRIGRKGRIRLEPDLRENAARMPAPSHRQDRSRLMHEMQVNRHSGTGDIRIGRPVDEVCHVYSPAGCVEREGPHAGMPCNPIELTDYIAAAACP